MRLQLRPSLRRAWRGPHTVQIGVSPTRGAVFDGLDGHDTALLDRLRDGLDPGYLDGLPVHAPRTTALIGLLADAGLLLEHRAGRGTLARLGPGRHRLAADAAVWSLVRPAAGDGWDLLAARASRRVVVTGGGRTGAALAATLVAAGVGSVVVTDSRPVTPADAGPGGAGPRDVGRPRREVAAETAARLLGDCLPAGASPADPTDTAAPDLVVLLDHTVADATRAEPLLSGGVPHLSVVVRDDDVLVGPLVGADGGPCLRCLDLHRQDRDPSWPSVLSQLLRPTPGAGEPEESAVSVLAAGLAALQVLGHLDGVTPAASGATLEVELPDGLVARREWPAHPCCGCQWRSPTGVPEVVTDLSGTSRAAAHGAPMGARSAGARQWARD